MMLWQNIVKKGEERNQKGKNLALPFCQIALIALNLVPGSVAFFLKNCVSLAP